MTHAGDARRWWLVTCRRAGPPLGASSIPRWAGGLAMARCSPLGARARPLRQRPQRPLFPFMAFFIAFFIAAFMATDFFGFGAAFFPAFFAPVERRNLP